MGIFFVLLLVEIQTKKQNFTVNNNKINEIATREKGAIRKKGWRGE